MTRKSMMGLVRRGRAKVQGTCYVVTWDIDSRDRSVVNRMQYFLFGKNRLVGDDTQKKGFVWENGVRYIAQSAVFVAPERLATIRRFLERNGIDHEVEPVLIP